MALPAFLAAGMRIASSAGAGAAAGEAAGAMSAGRAVATLGQAVGQLGQSARQTTNWVGGLAGRLTGELAKGLTLVIDMVGQAAAPIERLVRVANPAMADAFGRVMTDAYGVIGRMLLPVMESFIGVASKVRDVMAGLEPVFQPAINAVAKLVDVMGEEFDRALRDNAPVFELIADAFQSAVERATALVRVIGELTHFFREFAYAGLRLLGYGKAFDPNASGVGSAARQARFVQPKAIADEAIKNALMMGVGQKKAKTLDDVDSSIIKFYEWAVRRFGQAEAAATGAAEGASYLSPLANQAAGIVDATDSFSRWFATRR